MDFKSLYFKNPQNKKVPGKYYPYPVYEKTIGTDDFVEEISHSTSLTATDVRAVISEIIVIFRRYLARGHKLKLDGLGTFKVSFKGDGVPTADALTAFNIDRSTIRITFVSEPALKQEMQVGISFSKVTEKTDEKKAEEKPADGSGTQEN